MALADAIRRVFRGTPTPEQTGERQAFLRECADLGQDRCSRYRLYEDYYDGEQRTHLAARAKLYLEAGGVRFAENIVELGVDSLADRLYLEGFQVADDEDVSTWLTRDLWSSYDELQGIVHTETPKLGDGFVIVEWDGRLAMPRLRWNMPHLIKPVYGDDGDEMLFAVKKWASTRKGPLNEGGVLVWRLNLYFPDRVEKWFSGDKEGEDWAPWTDVAGEAWPIPWTESGEIPAEGEADDGLGVAVVHFRNKPKGRKFGRSEVRGMIPYQDEVNKQVLDLFLVMDAQGFQWPYVTGVTDADSVKLAIGDVLRLSDPNGKVGQLPAADPRPLLEAIDGTLRRFSAKTRTPLHDLIKGTPPSGEALKTAESGQVKKAGDRMASYGSAWSEAATLAWHLAVLYGPDDVPDFDAAARVVPVWDSAETRNEEAEATTALAHYELGVSRHSLLKRFGYDPEEEAQLRAAEREEDALALRSPGLDGQ